MVPVMGGSKIIDKAMSAITKEELTKVTMTWRQAHVLITAAAPHKLKHKWGGKGGNPFLPKGWPHGSEGILPRWCQRPSPHHMDGHHPPIQCSECAHQFQCQRTLYAGPYALGIDARSSVAYSGSTNGGLWRTTSGVLKGTYLPAQHKCSFHGIPTKTVVGQVAPANQVPPVVLLTRTSEEPNTKPPKRMALGGPRPQRLQGVAQIRAGTGQGAAT